MTIRLFAATIAAIGVAAGSATAQAAMPKTVHVRYNCGNLKVPVTYDNVKNRVLIQYGSRRYTLMHAMSADGARYANAKIEWWSKGSSATLSSVSDGKADTVLATCAEIAKK